MLVRKLSSTIVHVPFRSRAYKWAFGSIAGPTSVIVEMWTDDGLVGVGESQWLFLPYSSPATIKSIIDGASAYVIGENPCDIERIVSRIYGLGGWHFSRHIANWALSGVEMALWDIVAKSSGKPLHQLLGGKLREHVSFMYFVFRAPLRQMIKEANRGLEQGFETFYIKVGEDPVADLKQVRALRKTLGANANLRVDANESWSVAASIRMIKKMEKYDLEFVEQPVIAPDIEGLRTVRKRVSTPICADQSARTLFEVARVASTGAADIISISPSDNGGILASKKAAAVAESFGVPVFIHSNVEVGIATSAHLHLAASIPNCTYASQTEYEFLSDDVIQGKPFQLKKGRMEIPQKPGLGVALNHEKLAKFSRVYKKLEETSTRAIQASRHVPIFPKF